MYAHKMATIFWVCVFSIIPLSSGNKVIFKETDTPCARIKIRHCSKENVTSGECQQVIEGITLTPEALVMKVLSSDTYSNDITFNFTFPVQVVQILKIEVSSECRLIICDDENLLGLNCHQFGSHQSHNFLPSGHSRRSLILESFKESMFEFKAKSGMCVCEHERHHEDGSTKIEEHLPPIQSEDHFDRNFVGVMFCPGDDYAGGYRKVSTELAINDLYNNLLTVSSKFTQIAIYTKGLAKEPIEEALHAAADTNIHYSFLLTRWAVGITQDQLESVLDAIQETNQRFPGTVWGIFVMYNNFNPNLFKQIQSIKQVVLQRNLTQLKVGFHLTITEAIPVGRSARSPLDVKQVVQVADFMINRYIPTEEELLKGDLEKMEKTLLERREKYHKDNPRMKYFAETGIPSQGMWGNFKHSCTKFKKYWKKVAEFSNAKNLPFFMLEAVDQPWKDKLNDKLGNGSKFGWWKRNPEKLEEKCVNVTDEEDNSTEGLPAAAHNNQQWMVIVGGVGATCVILVLVNVAFFGKRWQMTKKKSRIDLRGLSETFLNGNANLTPSEDEKHYIVAIRQPYDKKNELSKDEVKILEEPVISSRDGVSVAHAKITGTVNCRAILKRTSAQTSVTSIKHLLSEIKIYCYIGSHEHVVRFLGAVTTQIEQGIVQLALEFCPLGSLESFLKRVDASLLEEQVPLEHPESEAGYSNAPPLGYVTVADAINISEVYSSRSCSSSSGSGSAGGYVLNYSDLSEITGRRESQESSSTDVHRVVIDLRLIISWCQQISSVMEFLSAKMIVHADLATRNILLASLNQIKLSDFGLAKRQYVELGLVMHEQDTPLPWRWMAPESLRRIVFSPQTDVWSCGVTMWEIFSLGQVPFQGLDHSSTFVDYLENNQLRLSQPRYASSSVYKLLLDCWNSNPEARPSFAELNHFFQELLAEVSESHEINFEVEHTQL